MAILPKRKSKGRWPRSRKNVQKARNVRRAEKVRAAPGHAEWIASLPCLGCGREGPNDPAHVRLETDGGTGLKPHDKYLVPLCHPEHVLQHTKGEDTYWRELRTDPLAIAEQLWVASGDTEEGRKIVMRSVMRHVLPMLERAL